MEEDNNMQQNSHKNAASLPNAIFSTEFLDSLVNTVDKSGSN